MQQRMEIEQTKKKPSAARRLLPLMVLILAGLIVSEPVVGIARRVYHSLILDQYALYRARVEQRQLQEANSRMRSELIALRTKRTKQGEAQEGVIAQKLSELESMIENVTGLGVFNNRKERSAKSAAGKSKSEGIPQGELAAILTAPQLSSPAGKEDADTKARGGVGGAEEPCDGHAHPPGAHREDISLSDTDDDLAPMEEANADDSLSLEQRLLVSRINRFIAVLEVLPLGSPVQGHLSSGFGHRRSPFSHSGSFHYGVDISLKTGSQVMSTGAGTVVNVEHDRTYGTLVDIRHSPGLTTRYAHLSRVLVQKGQEVQRGTVIALSGNTGRSTGPHLHYEVRHNGRPRNPAPFVQLASRLSKFLS
jgi:hypothetical protein